MTGALDRNKELLERFAPGRLAHLEQNVVPIFPDLVEHIIDDVYGFAYRRGHIDIRTRHLISLGVIAAMGGCENQLEFQLRAALNLNIPEDEVREVFIQVAVFAGNARAVNAAGIFRQILAQRQKEDSQ